MAKAKKYVSKGERNSVSKSTRKAVRRDRPATVATMLQSYKVKEFVMDSFNPKDKRLSNKYSNELIIKTEACRLFNRFGRCGLTWSAAVQAVKTDFVENLTKKWNKILREWAKEQSKKTGIYVNG